MCPKQLASVVKNDAGRLFCFALSQPHTSKRVRWRWRACLRKLKGIGLQLPGDSKAMGYTRMGESLMTLARESCSIIEERARTRAFRSFGKPHHAELAETIYRRLGAPTELKHLQVGRLREALIPESFSGRFCESCVSRARNLQDIYTDLTSKDLNGGEDIVGPMIIQNSDYGLCHHSCFRHVDYQIACIGAGQPVALPDTGKERARILDALTSHVHALGSWLTRRTAQEAVSVWPSGESIVRLVYKELGEPGPRKRWLAACLWKRLQEAQAHSGRGPLDQQPERFAIPVDALA